MQALQLGGPKFEASESQVFGISADNIPSQREFATKLKLGFPLLSDFVDRKVISAYGVLIEGRGMANRVTFVIDKDGKITFMEQGKAAIDLTTTTDACSRLAHRAAAP